MGDSPSGEDSAVPKDVANCAYGVLHQMLHLEGHLLAWRLHEDRDRGGILAPFELYPVAVLVPDLLHQVCRADVFSSKVIDAGDYPRTRRTRDSLNILIAYPPDRGYTEGL